MIKNNPILPSNTKKEKKFILAKSAKITLVVSPTKVAAPSRLENKATIIIAGNGLVLIFLHNSNMIGAMINTVATLSTNALIIPANIAKIVIAY
jgi:hypothetical protein